MDWRSWITHYTITGVLTAAGGFVGWKWFEDTATGCLVGVTAGAVFFLWKESVGEAVGGDPRTGSDAAYKQARHYTDLAMSRNRSAYIAGGEHRRQQRAEKA